MAIFLPSCCRCSAIFFSLSQTLVRRSTKRNTGHVKALQLVAAEGAPNYGGQALALQMAQLGVPTTLIPDAAIFAMMARVNKVAGCASMHLWARDSDSLFSAREC